MTRDQLIKLCRTTLWASLMPTGFGLLGCASYADVSPPPHLGSVIDETFRTQEENAEAAKYVFYCHEFKLNETTKDGDNPGGWRLNEYGEDHLRRVAVNMKRGDTFPIIVERSQTSSRPGTQFGYPVHFNDELDARRRQTIVAMLTALGVPDADQRVIVAPSAAEGIEAIEAANSYNGSLRGGGGFGWGGGIGGMGGMGGGGIF